MLVDTVKLMEERILKIENQDSFHNIHFHNTQYLINEIELLKVNSLENMSENKETIVPKSLEQESENKRCKWWNRGYCKFKQSCPYLHPKKICIEEQCLNKECKKRHPNSCKNWQKGSCRFENLCEFTHPSVNQNKGNSEKKIGDITINDDNYVDYDNIDSDDDSDDKKDTFFTVTNVNIHVIQRVT